MGDTSDINTVHFSMIPIALICSSFSVGMHPNNAGSSMEHVGGGHLGKLTAFLQRDLLFEMIV